jgi:hypothetical protein
MMSSYFSSWFPRKDNPDTASTSQSRNTPATSHIAGPGSPWTRSNDTVTATDYCLVFVLGPRQVPEHYSHRVVGE